MATLTLFIHLVPIPHRVLVMALVGLGIAARELLEAFLGDMGTTKPAELRLGARIAHQPLQLILGSTVPTILSSGVDYFGVVVSRDIFHLDSWSVPMSQV